MSHQVVASHTEPGRRERLLPAPAWVLDGPAGPMVRALSPDGEIYRHHSLARDRLREQKNLIIRTGTASGKTLVFQVGTMDTLARDPDGDGRRRPPAQGTLPGPAGRWHEAARLSSEFTGSLPDGPPELRGSSGPSGSPRPPRCDLHQEQVRTPAGTRAIRENTTDQQDGDHNQHPHSRRVLWQHWPWRIRRHHRLGRVRDHHHRCRSPVSLATLKCAKVASWK
jgi:hypothetical protein